MSELARALNHLAAAIERNTDALEEQLEADKLHTLRLSDETFNLLVLRAHSESEEELELEVRKMLREH